MDYLIQQKLNQLGIEVIGPSDKAALLDKFLIEQSEGLFSFLIENPLNRYLFNVLLRFGTLDVDNIPFMVDELNPERIKQSVNESFIKKYECPACKHLLIRKHLHEINYRKLLTRECPICNTQRTFAFKDFTDDFTVTRNDINKYLDRLAQLSVVNKRFRYLCRSCRNFEIYSKDLPAECKNCHELRELMPDYSFNSEFLQKSLERKDGGWFEWYVFMISRHIHETSEHNILISFKDGGIEKERELDVISIDKNQNLHVFECKDHLKRNSHFGDMESLPFLSKLFINIYYASSQKIDKNSARNIQELCKSSIKFIEGKELEQQFISLENVLGMFLDGHAEKAVRLCSRLAGHRKGQISEILISKLLDTGANDPAIIRSVSSLFWNHCIDHDIDEILIKDVIKRCINNIERNNLTQQSLDVIAAVFREYSKEIIFEVIDVSGLLKLGTPYLTKEPLVGYENRQPFFSFYKELFKSTAIESSELDAKIAQDFLLKFVPMFDLYYNWYNRMLTLRVIDTLWQFRNQNIIDEFISVVSTVLLNDKSDYDPENLLNFIVDRFEKFGVDSRNKILTILNQYAAAKPKYSEKVASALDKMKAKEFFLK
jgi:hypothetical protein